MAVATSLLALAAAGQTPAKCGPSAMVFGKAELQQRIAQLVVEAKDKGSSGATLEDYGSYRIQIGRASCRERV